MHKYINIISTSLLLLLCISCKPSRKEKGAHQVITITKSNTIPDVSEFKFSFDLKIIERSIEIYDTRSYLILVQRYNKKNAIKAVNKHSGEHIDLVLRGKGRGEVVHSSIVTQIENYDDNTLLIFDAASRKILHIQLEDDRLTYNESIIDSKDIILTIQNIPSTKNVYTASGILGNHSFQLLQKDSQLLQEVVNPFGIEIPGSGYNKLNMTYSVINNNTIYILPFYYSAVAVYTYKEKEGLFEIEKVLKEKDAVLPSGILVQGGSLKMDKQVKYGFWPKILKSKGRTFLPYKNQYYYTFSKDEQYYYLLDMDSAELIKLPFGCADVFTLEDKLLCYEEEKSIFYEIIIR